MLRKPEFDDIVLQKYELEDLQYFSKHTMLAEPPCDALLEFGLVAQHADVIGLDGTAVPSGTYSITEKGIRYLEYRWMFGWRNILKYAADNWIALLALIVAVVALFISSS